MISVNKPSRVLGVAFLFQFVTSLFSGTILRQALIVPGDISKSMINIADNVLLMRVNILVDMLTALGIIFLGTMLFTYLRKLNEKIALVAFAFYILEAALLAVSRIATVILLQVSQEYVTAGHPDNMKFIGNLSLESMDFVGSTLHMLVFSLGAILFYYLLYKSGFISKILSLWGLITVFPCLIGTLMVILGYQVSFFVYLPYAPFELVAGIWILVKGIRAGSEI